VSISPVVVRRRGAQKGRNERVGGEEGSCALADTSDNAVLIRERVTTGPERS
jgi:hypothetical protein